MMGGYLSVIASLVTCLPGFSLFFNFSFLWVVKPLKSQNVWLCEALNFAGRASKIATICHILMIQSFPCTPELLTATNFAVRKFSQNWPEIGHFGLEMTKVILVNF